MQDNGSIRQRGAVRLELDGLLFAGVENWRRSQPEIPSRSEAVRLLLALALSELSAEIGDLPATSSS
jgi:hypothetical protein